MNNKANFKRTQPHLCQGYGGQVGQIPEDWDYRAVSELAEIISGGTPKTSIDNYWNGSIPWLSVKDFKDTNRFVSKSEKNITKKGLENSSAALVKPGTLVISARGTVGEITQVAKEMTFNQSCYGLNAKEYVTNDFLFYALKNSLSKIKSKTHGSVFETIIRKTFDQINVPVPPRKEQNCLVEIFSSLDQKIELNRKMNETLEEIGKAIFKHWFIDFEFPWNFEKNEFDLEGEPYRSGGGRFKNRIPQNWEKKGLGHFFPIKTGKKNANIATENGEYPFFTCAQERLATNDYSFDTAAILLAGNGEFNVKWYRGKFEAYQRTYVLEPYDKRYLGYLYYLMERFLDEITAGHRGSVIKYITKGMIQNFEVAVPNDAVLNKMAKIFNIINHQIENSKNEIAKLEKIRDLLLPRLMSGRIRIKNV